MNKANLMRVLSAIRVTVQNENNGWLNGSCPLAPWTHANGTDRSASFGVKVEDHGRSHFLCYACKQRGSVLRLVRQLQHYTGRDFSALLTHIRESETGMVGEADFKPFDRPDEVPMPVIQPLNEALYDGLWSDAWTVEEARAYLKRRGISEATSQTLGLLWRSDYPPKSGRGRHWHRGDILFPVRDRDGQLYGWSARTTRDHLGVKPKVYDPDLPKRHLIMGEHRWHEGRPKVIVEGLFGYAHLIEIGVEDFADVGAVMGSVMTPEKAQILKGWEDAVVLLFDNDEAGEIGLFGPYGPDGRRDGRHGAVNMLVNSVVVIVPCWPMTDAVTQKADPDELTLEEVRRMVFETLPLAPPKQTRPRRLIR